MAIPVDDLIDHLKSKKPYGQNEALKLYEALKSLSSKVVEHENKIKTLGGDGINFTSGARSPGGGGTAPRIGPVEQLIINPLPGITYFPSYYGCLAAREFMTIFDQVTGRQMLGFFVDKSTPNRHRILSATYGASLDLMPISIEIGNQLINPALYIGTDSRIALGHITPTEVLDVLGNILASIDLKFKSATDFVGTLLHAITANRAWIFQDIDGILYQTDGLAVRLIDGGTGSNLTDPGADRILFWDDSAGVVTWLSLGVGLSITGTVLDAGYSTIQEEGIDVTRRNTLNFVGSSATALDEAAGAVVTFENVSNVQPALTATTTATLSHNIPSSVNRVLIAKIGGDSSIAFTVSGITFNGVGLTRKGGATPSGSHKMADIWYLDNPPVGTYNLVVTFSTTLDNLNECIIVAETFSGYSSLGSIVTGSAGSGSPSLVVSSAVNRLVTDFVVTGNALGVGAGQTERLNVTLTHVPEYAGSSTEPGGSSVTMSWTQTSTSWSGAAVEILPGTVPTRTNVVFAPNINDISSLADPGANRVLYWNDSINHIGFITPPAAYTQTFATVTRTHAARTHDAITDNTLGTPSTTIGDTPAAYSEAYFADALASIIKELNDARTDAQNTAAVLNQLIDDLQADGIIQ